MRWPEKLTKGKANLHLLQLPNKKIADIFSIFFGAIQNNPILKPLLLPRCEQQSIKKFRVPDNIGLLFPLIVMLIGVLRSRFPIVRFR